MAGGLQFFETLETALHKFAEKSLHPTEEAERHANATIQKLADALKRRSRMKIDRIITAGSYGKSTALAQHFDIDLVVFINDNEPPFKKVLQDFEYVLDVDDGLKTSNVHSTAHSVQFTLDGLDFDLLPATNFIKSNEDRKSAIERQQVLALAKIQSEFDRTEKYDTAYSSALAESQVGFLKNQTSFIHSLVRLCKFWLQTLDVGYFYGRGLIIELIAVSVGKEVEGVNKDPMCHAFLDFLEAIIRFNSIRIDFKQDRRTPSKFLNWGGAVIMDPTNPWNNLAKGVDAKVVQKLIGFAKETKRRLVNMPQYFPMLELLFLPQPFDPMSLRARPVPLIDLRGPVSYSHPKMIVHRNSKFLPIELEELKLRLEQTVVTQIQAKLGDAYANLNPKSAKTSSFDVQELVMKTVAKHIQGQSGMNWTFPHEKHEDYDVTFVIPFEAADGKLSSWISFKK